MNEKLTIPDVMPLVKAWEIERESNRVSDQALHCFMDDLNIEDTFLELTPEEAEQAPAAAALAKALLQMSKTQRRKIAGSWGDR